MKTKQEILQQRTKDLLDEGAERIKKHLEQKRKEEEKPLRDHFAGLALQGILSHYGFRESDELLAKSSYNVADAMLKARLVTEDKEVYGEL